jgi:predicted PurR-regulated permease PerM
LLVLLAGACFMIMLPFLTPIAWGVIVAITVHPGYRRLQTLLGGRGGLAATLCTLLLLAIFIAPMVALASTLVDGLQVLATRVQDGSLAVPPPPPGVENWPLVGGPLKNIWDLASTNLNDAFARLAPQLKALVPAMLSASAGIGLVVLQFILSIIIAGIVLANSRGGAQLAHRLFSRVFAEKGDEVEQLAGATIRSVTNGILGVAVIQTILASIGFVAVGLPAAGVWITLFLFGAVLQVGGVLLIPLVIYVFAVSSTTPAVLFALWCAVVGTIDNFLKPMLLGRGVDVPIAVVFLGVMGGFIAMGLVGLFVGPVILCVSYRLCVSWLEPAASEMPAKPATGTAGH